MWIHNKRQKLILALFTHKTKKTEKNKHERNNEERITFCIVIMSANIWNILAKINFNNCRVADKFRFTNESLTNAGILNLSFTILIDKERNNGNCLIVIRNNANWLRFKLQHFRSFGSLINFPQPNCSLNIHDSHQMN